VVQDDVAIKGMWLSESCHVNQDGIPIIDVEGVRVVDILILLLKRPHTKSPALLSPPSKLKVLYEP
jgi:hypothetical protein